jgi:hypothetical protein
MKRTISLAAVILAWPLAMHAGVAADTDGDGIPDVLDKCTLDSRNVTASCDSDGDGYGNPCDADFDQNFLTASSDFSMFFVPAFKGLDPAPWPQGMDMDCNGIVNSTDFSMFFVPKFKNIPAVGGTAPGPSCTPGC